MDTIRVMTTCMVIGQAAGIAAEITIDQALPTLADVPYGNLRQGLLDMKCIL